ncbi:MAG: hypothetical protein D4R84_13485 [Rhodocyclaceae bacterium]|nr:MAG: hypothetical protein D4R84_13485 [Rhodocyclaceae bacterium]
MVEVITGVAVFTALCLAIKALRLYGVIGLALLSMLMPLVTLVLALVGAVAYLLFHQRSK